MKYYLKIVLFWFLIFFILGVTTVDTNTTFSTPENLNHKYSISRVIPNIHLKVSSKSSGYVIHSPIIINNDQDFASQAILNGWMGNGSYFNPYVIENYNITITNIYNNAITINDVTTYFIIQYCYFQVVGGDSIGISLHSAQNAIISTNIIDNSNKNSNNNGLFIASSKNIEVFNNTINAFVYGIGLEHSNDTIISNNTQNANLDGIYITDSSNNILANNTISNTQTIGLDLYQTENITLTNNVINASDVGINIAASKNNIITTNVIKNNNIGINLVNSINNSVVNNICSNNTYYGIKVITSSENRIYYNDFIYNNNGHPQAYSDTVTNNWSDGTLGNFWSDYNGTDINNTGIGDIPYRISEGLNISDPYPLMNNGSKMILTRLTTFYYQLNTIGHVLSWKALSWYPNNYTIYKNNVEISSGMWTSGMPIKIGIDNLPLGSYNYTIVLTDESGKISTDSVTVNVLSCYSGGQASSSKNTCTSNNYLSVISPIAFIGFLIGIIGIIFFLLRKYWYEFGSFVITAIVMLYHPTRNLDEMEVINNLKRRKIIDTLIMKEEKGETLQNLVEELHISKQLLIWHIKVLEEFSLIKLFKIKGEIVLVHTDYVDKFDPSAKELELGFNSPQSQLFREFLINMNDGQSFSLGEILLKTNWNKKTAQRHLNRFCNLGILIKTEQPVYYAINPKYQPIIKNTINEDQSVFSKEYSNEDQKSIASLSKD